MKFTASQLNDFNKVDKLMNELNTCGDQHCGNIITSEQIKGEELEFLNLVNSKCRSKEIPKTKEEDLIMRKKYDTCFKKLRNSSNYYKKLTKRKKCEEKKCGVYRKKLQKMLSTRKNKKL